MAVSLQQLADAIATRAATCTGMRGRSYPPEDLQPPTAFPVFDTIRRSTMHFGIVEINFDLVYLVSAADVRSALYDVYGFCNPDINDAGSLFSVFETNKTLGLTGVDVTLGDHRLLGREEVAAYGYFGGAFEGIALITR